MPFDIRSFQAGPDTTQVETRVPGTGFTATGPQDYFGFFNNLLKAKMDWERWKIQQQMRMQRQAHSQLGCPSASQQMSAMTERTVPKMVYNPGTPLYATDYMGMTPFTGMVRHPWQPGMPNYSGGAPVAIGYSDRPVDPALAQLPTAFDINRAFYGHLPTAENNPYLQAKAEETRNPDTRAGYFGSTYGRS